MLTELAPPDSTAKLIASFEAFAPPDTTGWAIRIDHKISDTLTAPAWLYIPTGYDPAKRTPLMIALHGGVSGPEFRVGEAKEWLDDPVVQLAEREGWLLLYPLGKTGCAWWDETGMENILWFVREVKGRFNVDDNLTAMGGFSDGGSGSFQFAMVAATDFAVFFPWSGHIAVGTLVGGVSAYLLNLQARPLFASNGGRDQLYPAAKMDLMHRLAFDAGSPFSVTYYDTAGHNYGYMPAEWALAPERFRANPRDCYPPTIYFETANVRFGRSDWISIEGIDTSLAAAEWHRDYNQKQTDERLTIGFVHDQAYKGKGVRVLSVTEDPELPAMKAGLKAGDIVTQIDDVKIEGIADVGKAKMGRKRGDPIKLVFKRGWKTIKAESAYPPVAEYDLFPRRAKSGAVRARRIGNVFEIESSRVTKLSLDLSPNLVNFAEPVRVIVNGTALFEGVVTPQSKTIVEDFRENRDRKRLVWAKLTLEVPR